MFVSIHAVHSYPILDWYISFLYADPTPSALQVLLRQPGLVGSDITGLPSEEGNELGVWINADPIPGCVVCNIGESTLFFLIFLLVLLTNCPRV